MLILPKQQYIRFKKDGKLVTYCTLRQLVCHIIGYNKGGRNGGIK